MKRSSGILLPISSLPSPYGIGSLGKAAFDFVDWLADAGQSWWQILPVGPTSYGDSPYQSPSTFAGNPYFVDLDLLIADGLLTKREVTRIKWSQDLAKVDYAKLYQYRMKLLACACERGWDRDAAELEVFIGNNAHWIHDYALFMATKEHFDMVSWIEWPDQAIRLREPEALRTYGEQLAERIRVWIYAQFLFFKQWEALRSYAHSKGVGIIGDLPIYVALDSADVWANPSQFMLDEKNVPVEVAGVPPDAFTADGQLWGNPLYNYEAMRADGWGWWIRRIGGAAALYDVIRIDHFRGFDAYWAVPYGDTTAKGGHWVTGPGYDMVEPVLGWFPQLDFIAEDLGYPSPGVVELLRKSGLPGMKVLEFAFDTRDEGGSAYLPHNHTPNAVCYLGTHDNETLLQWKDSADPKDVALAERYLGLNQEEGFTWGFMRAGMASVCNLFVAQMQDLLELGAEARMNKPGTLGGNWCWRMVPGQATPQLAERINTMTHLYGRSSEGVWQR